jgi:Trm5-related predicted tRNA methylase
MTYRHLGHRYPSQHKRILMKAHLEAWVQTVPPGLSKTRICKETIFTFGGIVDKRRSFYRIG